MLHFLEDVFSPFLANMASSTCIKVIEEKQTAMTGKWVRSADAFNSQGTQWDHMGPTNPTEAAKEAQRAASKA